MLRSVKNFHLTEIVTRDGYLGHLDRLIFNEMNWHVNYFVVEGGEEFEGKKIVLSSHYYDGFDWPTGSIKSRVEKTEIEQSPEISQNIPKAKISEKQLAKRFGWEHYDKRNHMFIGIINGQNKKHPHIERKGNPGEMTSTNELFGYEVRSLKQKLGYIDDLAVDEGDLVIKYIIAKPYPQISERRLLISTDWVKTISWLRKMVFLTIPADSIVESSML